MNDETYHLAKSIIDIKTKEVVYTPKEVSFQDILEKTSYFYKSFFNGKRNNEINFLDNKIAYLREKSLNEFNARAYITDERSIIKLPTSNNIKTASALVHEKAHTYQSIKDINECIPSFFELLFSFKEDKSNNGLLKSNINYKIKEAKKVAEYYVYCKRTNKRDLTSSKRYLNDFYDFIRLFNTYFKNKELVTKTLEDILFENGKLDSLKKVIYQDGDLKNNCYNISLWNVFLLPKYPCFIN